MTHALETLATWRELLAGLGTLGDELVAAIDAGEVVRAIGASMQVRDVRAALLRVEATSAGAGDDGEMAAAIAEVAALIVKARLTESIAAKWLARGVPTDPVLLGSPLGVAVLADVMLPATWDRATDLVVLVGGGLGDVAALLADLGQKRVVTLRGTGGLRVESPAELTLAVRMMVPSPPARVVVRGAPGVALAEVEAASAAVEVALSELRIHRNTIAAFSQTWIEHGLANLPAIAAAPTIAEVGDRFRGMPMVIVAPGPSLAKNAHRLRELKGRALVCAFSHSLKPVIAAGVVPDFVLTVDPQDVRYHFEGCDVSGSTIVNSATVHPALFELGAASTLTLAANCTIDDWIFEGGEPPHVPGGGSVATTALSLALRWGCNPIIYVGLDLSFPGGKYYVGTSHDGDARAVVDPVTGQMSVAGWSDGFEAMKSGGGPAPVAERAVELPAWENDGGVVPSSFMFSLFHRWFVDRLEARDAAAVRVLNCTEGGCYIPGMEHVAFADAIAALPRSGVDRSGLADVRIDPARAAAVRARLATFTGALARTRELAVQAADADGRALERLEQQLVRSLKSVPFLSLLAQREIERASDLAGRSDTDYLAASRALFATLVDVVDRIAR